MSELEYDTEPEFEPDLSAELDFDPARRRRRGRRGRFLFDPARRRRRHGRMPAGLARYWAGKRGRTSYHPGRRRRHRGRSHFDPARRHHFGRRGRRYDPIFGGPGSWRDITSDYGLVALGSILHNYVVHKLGYGANVRNAGPINATDAGLAAGAVGIVGQKMGYIPGWLGKIFQGMFSEGLNYPAAEQMQRTGPNQAAAGSDSGAYGNATPGNAITSRSAAAQGPVDYSYLTAWGYT